jgi:hypothetical protein
MVALPGVVSSKVRPASRVIGWIGGGDKEERVISSGRV